MPWVLSHWFQWGRVPMQVRAKRPGDEGQGWHHAVCYSRIFHGFFMHKKTQSFEVQQNPVLFGFIAC
jgi:hypothetical protein